MAAIRKIKRVGKRAFKFQYSATYQSAVIECQAERWCVCNVSICSNELEEDGDRLIDKSMDEWKKKWMDE